MTLRYLWLLFIRLRSTQVQLILSNEEKDLPVSSVFVDLSSTMTPFGDTTLGKVEWINTQGNLVTQEPRLPNLSINLSIVLNTRKITRKDCVENFSA